MDVGQREVVVNQRAIVSRVGFGGSGLSVQHKLESYAGHEVFAKLTEAVDDRVTAISDLWDRLATEERARRINESRPPEAGFAAIAHGWAAGSSLEELFGDDQLAAGDFVALVEFAVGHLAVGLG